MSEVRDALPVVVMGTGPDAPPPGIQTIAEIVELRFADTVGSLEEALEGAEILFAWRPNRDLLPAAWPRAGGLRWIQSASAGVDGLLFPQLVDSDVTVTNARGVFDGAIAEFVLGLMLAFAKGFPVMFERGRRREWQHFDTERLSGKRLLVLGVGPIGRAVARIALPLGIEARGLGRTARPGDDLLGAIYETADLPTALGWADYVVNTLPATPGTYHLFDARAFAAMKPSARFINVGRGSTVDEAALVEALRNDVINAAALDVFEEEPLPADSALWGMSNVIVAPHMSGDFAGWREALVELFVDNLGRYVAGQSLRNVVDKRLGYVRATDPDPGA